MAGDKEATQKVWEPQVKRTVKDSVFTDLFDDKKYALSLYSAIHPEDTDVSIDDINLVTIENVITDQEYNDLGMTVRDKLLLLMEAQSVWTYNIAVRILLYLAQTWNIYLKETNQNRYSSTKVFVPKPELYVVFTGSGKDRPEWINLADEFFEGDDTFLNVKVKCLYGTKGARDILSQYVDFTHVCNEQLGKYGTDIMAAQETIRICKERDILKEYLSSREKEVVSIMMALFDKKEIQEQFGNARYHEGRREEKIDMVRSLADMGMPIDQIAKAAKVSVEVIKSWLAPSVAK